MTKEAIVLAGGLGTRLQSVVKDVPKPMAEVAGRPFLDFILYALSQNGVTRAVLAVGHKYEVIQEHYKSGNSFGIELAYSVETELLGTGGAIFQATGQLQGDNFFILNGDTFFEVPLQDLQEFAVKKEAELAMALKAVPNSDRYGSVVCSPEQRITSFKEKQLGQKQDLLINGGVYWVQKQLLDKFKMPQKFSFEVDFLQSHLAQMQAYGKAFDGTFIDIGIPEDYNRAQILLQHVIR